MPERYPSAAYSVHQDLEPALEEIWRYRSQLHHGRPHRGAPCALLRRYMAGRCQMASRLPMVTRRAALSHPQARTTEKTQCRPTLRQGTRWQWRPESSPALLRFCSLLGQWTRSQDLPKTGIRGEPRMITVGDDDAKPCRAICCAEPTVENTFPYRGICTCKRSCRRTGSRSRQLLVLSGSIGFYCSKRPRPASPRYDYRTCNTSNFGCSLLGHSRPLLLRRFFRISVLRCKNSRGENCCRGDEKENAPGTPRES